MLRDRSRPELLMAAAASDASDVLADPSPLDCLLRRPETDNGDQRQNEVAIGVTTKCRRNYRPGCTQQHLSCQVHEPQAFKVVYLMLSLQCKQRGRIKVEAERQVFQWPIGSTSTISLMFV